MNISHALSMGDVLARGLSRGRRQKCRPMLGTGRGFATDLNLVYLPWPLPPELADNLACCIALQASPSKELIATLPLARLSGKEQRALQWLEAEHALAWVLDKWPGLKTEIMALSGPIQPADAMDTGAKDPAQQLLKQAVNLACTAPPAEIPPVFGQLPLVRAALSSLSAQRSQLEARLPWSSKKRLERLNNWSVAIASNDSDMVAKMAGQSEPDQEERLAGQRKSRVGIPYPEWNAMTQTYRDQFVSVIEQRVTGRKGKAAEIDPRVAAWFREPVSRQWLGRLEDGTDIDIDALIATRYDELTGQPQANRYYRDRLPSRRDVATVLLIDRSGSLAQANNLKYELDCANALCSAMQDSGERYAVYSFWSDTRHHVAIDIWRDFDDGYPMKLEASRLKPRGYTRIGGAIRHTTARLRQQASNRHVMMVLGDAVPSDEGYEGQYAVADVCKAVEEAQELGITVVFIAVGNPAEDPLGEALGDHLTRVSRVTELAPVLADVHARLCC